MLLWCLYPYGCAVRVLIELLYGWVRQLPSALLCVATHQHFDIKCVYVLFGVMCEKVLPQLGTAEVTQEVFKHWVILAGPIMVVRCSSTVNTQHAEHRTVELHCIHKG